MIESARAIISFRSDWLASTGGTGSGDLDEVVQRGSNGLPVLPMSSLRGVLRESAGRLAAIGAGGWSEAAVEILFGKRSNQEPGQQEQDGATEKPYAGEKEQDPGVLLFPGDARLRPAERAAFAAEQGREARNALFARLQSTAIDPDTGTAAARTLRAAETAVPMTLEGKILLDRTRIETLGQEAASAIPKNWVELLDAAAAWTLALGKGKADGLGRVTIAIETAPDKVPAAAHGRQDGAADARRLVVAITQTEKAAFSVRSASEGTHDTRLCVPGSAMLGWAAREYASYDSPYDVFHSGAVRFGDGRPVTGQGEALWPMPAVIRQPKGSKSAKSGQLDPAKAVLRELPNSGVQFEKIGAKLVTISGCTGELRAPAALRTAMRDGRPQTGLLFGYRSLLAAPDDCQRYVAVIEADQSAISDHDWALLRAAFDGKDLLLGRAAGAGQGGCFRCEILPDCDLYGSASPPASAPTSKRVVVWALSDIALLNEYGDPDLAPGPQTLGMDKGHLLKKESAINTRRYAPWRAHLAARDVDHCVIEAGSVLVFEVEKPNTSWPSVVGLHRELGLGRVAINPSMLRHLLEDDDSRTAVTPDRTPKVVWDPATWTEETPEPNGEAKLFAWAQSRVRSREAYGAVIRIFQTRWESELASLYAAEPAGEGPSRKQWRDAADAPAQDIAGLRRALFEGDSPVCGKAGQATRISDWGKNGWPVGAEPTTFRQWLGAKLAAEATLDQQGQPDALGQARQLLRLAADGCNALAKAREGTR
jgi:CRISPR-associated protein Csx10